MLVDGIDAESHQLDAALVEFRLKLGQGAKLGGANRSEILRVREQQCPAVADPVMEFDLAVGGFSLEIRGHRANLQSHIYLLSFTDEIAGIPASEMLIADPLLQIAPNCLLVGQTAKDRLAKVKPDMTMSAAGIQPASISMK